MGSQFVDLNGDGHLDYLTATFDGSPHIAYGSATGFGKPERLKDAQGERIVISSIWDYDAKKHVVVDRAFAPGKAPDERCISALAFDWDGDGDLDLLLGSYENGHLYLQMNEGSATAPKFTGKVIPVMAGDAPFALPAKMTAPRLVDWDGDGDLDLIAGSFGESYGQAGKGGGVYLALNHGRKGAPKFGALQTLIPPSPKGQSGPTRPDAGLYADAVDYDGDGDLDLVVGGYSMWTPRSRELTAEEQEQLSALRAQQRKLGAERSALMKKVNKAVAEACAGMDPKSTEYRAKAAAARAGFQDELLQASRSSGALMKEIEALVPGPKRESFVWLYERLPAAKGADGNQR